MPGPPTTFGTLLPCMMQRSAYAGREAGTVIPGITTAKLYFA